MLNRIKFYISVIQIFGLGKGLLFLIRKKLNSNKIIRLPGVAHPIFLRPNTSDEMAFLQIFIDKEYDINIGFTPKTIIDGGANIGMASVFFKNRYPDAKIIAIEPDAGNIAALKTNVAKYSDIFIKQAGLWSKKTKSKVVDQHDWAKWALVIEETGGGDGGQNEIDTLTIGDVMAEYGLVTIDLLKLDIESAEKQVFSENYENWLPKTKVIVIELHDWMKPGCSKAFFTAINSTINNYSFSQLGENTVIINHDLVG